MTRAPTKGGRRETSSRQRRRAIRTLVTGLKGGIGKTTLAVQMAAALARPGRLPHSLRVLIIDLDPQGNTTFYITGLANPQYEHHVGTVLEQFSKLDDRANQRQEARRLFASAVLRVQDPSTLMISEEHRAAWGSIDILPGHTDCAWLTFKREHLRDLQHILDAISEDYDVILVDAAPSAWALTLVGLYAVHQFIAVTTPAAMSMHGLNQLFGLIGQIKHAHPELTLAGVVANQVRRRHQEHAERMASLEAQLGVLLKEPYIGGHTDVEKAEGAHRPLHAMPGGMARYLSDIFDTLSRILITKERA